MKPFLNPPITEAVFEVTVKLPQNINLEVLQTFHEEIKGQFPNRKERRKMAGGIHFEGTIQPKLISAKNEVYGYQHISSNNTKVVQARLDGFAFNKLKPYSNWEEFSGEAVQLLGHYIAIAKPERITKLALRYINRIGLPIPFIDFNEYLTTIPTLAPKLDFSIARFFANFLVVNDEIDALASITETIENENPDEKILPFIFDIDVFKNVNMEMDIGQIMVNMNQLRNFKNKLFVESLTNKTLDLFK